MLTVFKLKIYNTLHAMSNEGWLIPPTGVLELQKAKVK